MSLCKTIEVNLVHVKKEQKTNNPQLDVHQNVGRRVRPSGFEPETLGLEGRCSIQLSYERMVLYIQDL